MTDEPMEPLEPQPADPEPEPEPERAEHEPAGDATPALQLYLLRHADAGDPAAWRGNDADRPLSKKGRRQAAWVGRWLRGQRKLPGVVVTSPKVRAVQTAALATEGSGVTPIVDERLAVGFGLEDVAGVLRDHAPDARRVMLVGHDPDFSELASELAGGKLELKKGAVARIDLAGGVHAGGGTLRWLVPPEALADQ
jgi:phosphohistidine phosphatase